MVRINGLWHYQGAAYLTLNSALLGAGFIDFDELQEVFGP